MPHQLQNILDTLLEGVVVLDRTERIEQINPEACRLLRVSADAAIQLPLSDLLERDHVVCRAARRALATGRPSVHDELTLQARGHPPILVDMTSSPLQDAAGERTGVVIVFRDRTIHAALQEVVAERERLATLGNIATGIAHEVKNPLGGIRGAAELLVRRSAEDKTRETAELIVREVDRIARLVDELMVFGRGEKLELAPTNLHQLLDEVIDLLSHDPLAQHTRFHRAYDPSIPEIQADRNRLTQVFLNLTRNALQAMGPAGGELVLGTRMTLDQRLTAPNGESCPTVLIEFIDSGPGIPEDVLEHVFTPFFTTRVDGTGLGLPVAGHWITLHGGTLRIDNHRDGGAVVRIALPLRREHESK